MAYVVCEPCHDCKYTDCVVVCPCECFYEDGQMLYIDPDHCIDCDACQPECPVEAIFQDVHVPSQWQHFVELNRVRSAELLNEGHIVERKDPLIGPGCRK